MKLRNKIFLGLAAALLIGPFLVPVESSGTLTNLEAAEKLWGGRSQFLELAEHDVHYVTAGDKNADRLILLAHGFGASAYSYRDVMTELSKHGFVIAYDRAAFGFTERPTDWQGASPYSAEIQLEVIDGLISSFGTGKQVVLVGHSAGGALAAGYAIQYPERLDAVVLYAAAVYGSGGTPDWLNWVYDIPQLDHLGPLAVSSIASSGLEILERSYFDKTRITAQTTNGYTAPLQIKGWERAFWRFNKAPRNLELQDSLRNIAIPTLVITGDTDLIVPTENSLRLAKEIKGSTLEIISETGHLPNEEKPQEFADAIIRFLETLG